MRIKWAAKAGEKDSVVLIAKKGSSFDPYINTRQEKEYLSFNLKHNKKRFLFNQFPRWIFVSIVNEEKDHLAALEDTRKSASRIAELVNARKLKSLTVTGEEGLWEHVLAFTEGLALGTYQFNKYANNKEDKFNTLDIVKVSCLRISKPQVEELGHLVEAVYKTRDLVNEPLSHLTALELSKEIEKMGEEAGFGVETLHKKKIQSLRMGGILAVNKGSIDPPTFSILTWKPENARNARPIVLVGKGVVYDTGGFSLKPTLDSMDYMKCDMAGAAAVAGTFYALAKNKVPVYAVGLVPATDNRLNGNAYVPGDIVRMFNGSTVEVMNTDAEGRMLLADALTWADKLEPSLIFTVATLTGSAHAAIGKYGIVAMGNAGHKEVELLKESGERVFERIAEFPFWDEYNDLLKSDVGDLKNIGGRYGGAITAGKFLEYFTDFDLIHLDIAGPAFNKIRDSYRGKGGSGTGLRLLYDFLKHRN